MKYLSYYTLLNMVYLTIQFYDKTDVLDNSILFRQNECKHTRKLEKLTC